MDSLLNIGINFNNNSVNSNNVNSTINQDNNTNMNNNMSPVAILSQLINANSGNTNRNLQNDIANLQFILNPSNDPNCISTEPLHPNVVTNTPMFNLPSFSNGALNISPLAPLNRIPNSSSSQQLVLYTLTTIYTYYFFWLIL